MPCGAAFAWQQVLQNKRPDGQTGRCCQDRISTIRCEVTGEAHTGGRALNGKSARNEEVEGCSDCEFYTRCENLRPGEYVLLHLDVLGVAAIMRLTHDGIT